MPKYKLALLRQNSDFKFMILRDPRSATEIGFLVIIQLKYVITTSHHHISLTSIIQAVQLITIITQYTIP
jgi:hypothetical protein